MSFKRKLISAAASAFAVVAFTTFVSAQDSNTSREDNSMQKQEMREKRGGKRGFGGRGMRGGKHGGKMIMRSLAKLNLSEAQKQQTGSIFQNYKLSTQTQREELRALRMKKRDGSMTAAEQSRVVELRTQLKSSGEQMKTLVLAVLTADQRAQLEQMKEERRKRMQERRQNRQNQPLSQSQDS